jgi:hypothetical protein
VRLSDPMGFRFTLIDPKRIATAILVWSAADDGPERCATVEAFAVVVLIVDERLVDTMWTLPRHAFAWQTTLFSPCTLVSPIPGACGGSAKPDESGPRAGV